MNAPLVKVPLRYGLIAGALGFVLTIVLYYYFQHPLLIPPYIDFRVFLFGIFIFFALKELRDYYFDGVLYFWQGMIAALILTAVFAVVASAALLVFMRMDPDFLADYIRLSTEYLQSLPTDIIDRIGKEQYERNLEQLPSTNAIDVAFTWLVQSFIISFFLSVILSVILSRQPKT